MNIEDIKNMAEFNGNNCIAFHYIWNCHYNNIIYNGYIENSRIIPTWYTDLNIETILKFFKTDLVQYKKDIKKDPNFNYDFDPNFIELVNLYNSNKDFRKVIKSIK